MKLKEGQVFLFSSSDGSEYWSITHEKDFEEAKLDAIAESGDVYDVFIGIGNMTKPPEFPFSAADIFDRADETMADNGQGRPDDTNFKQTPKACIELERRLNELFEQFFKDFPEEIEPYYSLDRNTVIQIKGDS